MTIKTGCVQNTVLVPSSVYRVLPMYTVYVTCLTTPNDCDYITNLTDRMTSSYHMTSENMKISAQVRHITRKNSSRT
jgi:hypothetical protein